MSHHATFIIQGSVYEVRPGRGSDKLRLKLDHENGVNYSLFEVVVPTGSAAMGDEVIVTGIISTTWDKELRKPAYHYNAESCEVTGHKNPVLQQTPQYNNPFQNPYSSPAPPLDTSPNTYGQPKPQTTGMRQRPGDTRYTIPEQAQQQLFEQFLQFIAQKNPP